MPLGRQGKRNLNIGGVRLDCGGEVLVSQPPSRLKILYHCCCRVFQKKWTNDLAVL